MKSYTVKGKKKIILIGAGFAGLKFAKCLRKSDYDITIIDRHNYHEFAPLFYQIASCGLEPGAICFPLRKEFHKTPNIHFRLGEVLSIDPQRKIVSTDIGDFPYDYLIMATGTTTKFFGIKNMKDYTFTLKTTSESLLIRNQILLCFERAIECQNSDSRKKMLTFIISGAGPAGVEISGALGEMKKYVLPREYPELNPEEMRILIIEASDKVLRTMSDHASKKSYSFLKELEVEIKLNTSIVNYDGNEVITSDGEHIPSDTLIWTAGVEGTYFEGFNPEDYGPSNRFLVDTYNRLLNYDSIFALGDCCLMQTPEKPHGDPQVAQVAMQQAYNLAKNLKKGEMNLPFIYKDKGSMATIGRNRAVVDLKYKKMAGRFAWWMWLLVHLLTLVGIRNKIVTFINWIWNYFSYNSSLRLLIKPAVRDKRPKPECCMKKDDEKCPYENRTN